MLNDPTIVLAVSFFAGFAAYMRWRRLPASIHMYHRTNRAHLAIYLAYAVAVAVTGIWQGAFIKDILVDGLLGTYIYFSLYYVFVFPLIGLAKNSISINLLTTIQQLQSATGRATRAEVIRDMTENMLGPQDLRDSRLYQLTYLGFSEKRGASYKCTEFGKATHKLASAILSVWNQRRL